MSQSNQNISKFFPRLNIDVLKVHAARWAARWPDVPIDRIILYNYASESQKHYDEPIKYKKYAVVFEIPVVDKLRILTSKGQFRYDFAVASGKITPDPFYEFVKDIEYNTSIDQDKKYKALITEDFTNVYWEKPDDEFRREWVFIPRTLVYDKKEKNLIFEVLPVNVRLGEPYEVLFQDKAFENQDIPPAKYENEIIFQSSDDLTIIKAFPCKPGTLWRDVKITLISNDAVKIETPNGSGRYHFSELSMKDERKGDIPTMLWELLKYFCEYSGRVSSTTSVDRMFSLRFRNLSKSISDLNKKLQNIFGIDENFCHKYNKRAGWVAKCQFNDNTFSE